MESVEIIIALTVVLAMFAGAGLLGAYVAAQKGREPAEGAVFGALLGPVGLLIVALLPNGGRGAGSSVSRSRATADDQADYQADARAAAFLETIRPAPPVPTAAQPPASSGRQRKAKGGTRATGQPDLPPWLVGVTDDPRIRAAREARETQALQALRVKEGPVEPPGMARELFEDFPVV